MDRKYIEKLRIRLKDKFIICVTGIPGCGKSLFCILMSKFGAHYISADEIVAGLLTRKKCCSTILRKFGSSVFSGDFLDKKKLAGAVFKNKRKRKWLEDYLHPLVVREIYSGIKKSRKRMFVVEVPLLFESGFDTFADLTVCITSKLRNINSRLRARGWTPEHFKDRAQSQFSQEKKALLCDLVVENNSTIEDLEGRAKEISEFLKRLV